MTAPRHRIVIALDLTDYAEIVLEHALDQAARQDAPDLHFVSVVGDDTQLDDAKRKLAALALPALDGLPTTEWHAHLHVRCGAGPEEIANLAAEIRAHLLVIGRFGTHHPHRKIGNTAARIIELATCPTLVIGFGDQAGDVVAQCPRCVEVRASSEGERWFCSAHVAPNGIQLSARVPRGSTTTGGLMW